MRVLILHDQVDPTHSSQDALDAITQANTVAAALQTLGHTCQLHGIDYGSLNQLEEHIVDTGAEVVFNLVESLGGEGRYIHLAPTALDTIGIPFTGNAAPAIHTTSNKLTAKKLLSAQGIPTPPWLTLPELRSARPITAGTYILKSVWEHASIGIDASSVVQAEDAATLHAALKARLPALGGEGFAEAFVEGREFNVSLLEQRGGVEVLPPAEILFNGFAPDQPHIVDYRAKWDSDSFAYHHTPRTFDFTPQDAALLENLRTLAKTCWHLFDLRGYARVDFRVDANAVAWVLEINTNPCLSPDAGFLAACARGGLEAPDVMRRLMEGATRRH